MDENKSPKKEVQKVEGKIIRRKKSPGKKFLDTFIADDARNIKSYITEDFVIPYVKGFIGEVIERGVEMLLWGNDVGRPYTPGKPGSFTNYNKFSKAPNKKAIQTRQNRFSNGKYFDDILCENRGQAEYILMEMYKILDQFERVSIADLYEILNDDDHIASYTDNKYGWDDLSMVDPKRDIRRVRGGLYLLDLPKAMPLD